MEIEAQYIEPIYTSKKKLSWRRYNDRFRNKLKRNKKRSGHDIFCIPPEDWPSKTIEVPKVSEMIENCNNAANWLYEGSPYKALDKADLLHWPGRFELSLQLLGMVKELDEFNKTVHFNRYSLLAELCKTRAPSLSVVPVGADQ